jgi:RNA-directed DNA polymerase
VAPQEGNGKWHVYTFIADRPIRSVKVKIRALTHRQSQQELGSLLIRLNQIMRGWANHFKHTVAKDRFDALHRFVWWRLIRMLQVRHRWSWKDSEATSPSPPGDGYPSRRRTGPCCSTWPNAAKLRP